MKSLHIDKALNHFLPLKTTGTGAIDSFNVQKGQSEFNIH